MKIFIEEEDYNDPFKIMQYLGDSDERDLFCQFLRNWPAAHFYLTVDLDEIVFEGGELNDAMVTITFDARR